MDIIPPDSPPQPNSNDEAQAAKLKQFYAVLAQEMKAIKEIAAQLGSGREGLVAAALILCTLRGGLNQLTELLTRILILLTQGPPMPPGE